MAEGLGMAANGYRLVIGDKNLSSWSLRPWLALKQCGIPFVEERVRLRQPSSKAEILRHSPSGKVPVLKTEAGVVWDSLAILEFLAERHPDCALWPREGEARAAARSISAEMHAGFATLRNAMSMDLLGRPPSPPIEGMLESDIRRIVAIWKDTQARFGKGGPLMFGLFPTQTPCTHRSRRDFAPTASILPAMAITGRPPPTPPPLVALPAMREWIEGAEREASQASSAWRPNG